MANDWKDRLGMVYSTNSNYDYKNNGEEEQETISPKQQNLKVSLDRKKRKGKNVTLVTGFTGSNDDLKELGKLLKTKCGVGGTVKNEEILIQGDFCDRVIEILKKENYKVKRSGG